MRVRVSLFSSSSSFWYFLRSNAVLSLNAILPSISIKEKSTKASDDEQPQTLVPQEVEFGRTVHVGNLRQSTKSDLIDYFSKYGEIEKVDLMLTKFSRLPRGFAFVTFCEKESAKKVLANSHPIVAGDNITVNPLRTEKKLPKHTNKDLVVLVTSILKTTSKKAIESHFSQFGKVKNVILAQEGKSDGELDKYYVALSSISEVKRSLEEPTQRIAEQDIDSKVMAFSEAEQVLQRSTNLFVRSLEDNVSVYSLREYFQNFGDVESVEVFLDSSNVGGSLTVACVHFSKESTVDKFLEREDHVINGMRFEVLKRRSVLPWTRTNRQRISVEGLPLSIGKRDVQQFFKNVIELDIQIVFFRKDSLNGKVHCIIRCINPKDVTRILAKKYAQFQEEKLHFNPLLWSKSRPD